jgi:hypothetical protein
MIRKVILAILTTLTIAAVVAFILSYTVRSKLESFAPGQEPLQGILAKDVPMLYAIGEFYHLRESNSETSGLLIQLWKSNDLSRVHLHACAGSISFMLFEEMDPDRSLFRNESGWGGFSVVELNTFGPWLQMVTFDTDEGKRWANDCFRDVWIFEMPLWFLVLVFGTYPFAVLVIAPLRRHRRRKRNECIQCGYSLTGLTEPRCPECGNRVGFAVRTGG